jgi:hypothetical protein
VMNDRPATCTQRMEAVFSFRMLISWVTICLLQENRTLTPANHIKEGILFSSKTHKQVTEF